jgi:hypothetical protein
MLERGGDVALRADAVVELFFHDPNLGRGHDTSSLVSPCEREFGRKSRFVARRRQSPLAKRHA